MGKRPVIALVTGTEMTRRALAAQLQEVIGDVLDIRSFALDEGVAGEISGDLVVVSSGVLLAEEGFRQVQSAPPRLIARRIINYNNLEQLMTLTEGTRALLVNDVEEAARESIVSLQKLGLDHLEYVPFTRGSKDVSGIDIAITPGEKDFVPAAVPRVIDIGPRLVDITTILEIMRHFNLAEQVNLNLSEKFMNKIVHLGKELARQNIAAQALNSHLRLVLDGINQGILAYDSQGVITVYNENLEGILRVSPQKAIGKRVSAVVKDPDLYEFINGGDLQQKRFAVHGRDVIVHRFFFAAEATVVCTFTPLSDDPAEQKKIYTDLRNRGYVAKYSLQDIIGSSSEILRMRKLCNKLAQTDLTILIEGESGTGKELFASAIHTLSARRAGPFLAVNFSALPEELVESELFGYEEGAFTGAVKGGKAGLFEQAQGGTIFLDEIGDISIKIQTRLLRVLQEKEVMRIGGSRILPVDVRVIAATNRNLEEMIEQGQFRQDLFHRLKVLYLNLPPLRKRKEDLRELFYYFLRLGGGQNLDVDPEVVDKLGQYQWYGNVRELKNTIDYMLAVCNGVRITPGDIPDYHFFQKRPGEPPLGSQPLSQSSEPGLVEQWKSSGELTIYQFVLETVATYNRRRQLVGRRQIAELSAEKFSAPLSEQQVRHRLGHLESWGMITKSRGRRGTIITPVGMQMIEHLPGRE